VKVIAVVPPAPKELMPAPAVIVTLPRAVVLLAMLMAFLSVTWVPVVPPAPPLSTTLLKSLVAVVSVASANGVIVTVLVEVIDAACVIEPAVEVRLSTGTVTAAGVAPPATFNVPPLERETGFVPVAVMPLV